jgi:hypothetical protein
MALTVAAVDAIRSDLAAIPAKDESAREVTRLEAIARMRGEIFALRDRGYSWLEVAEIVSSKGCRVTAATLRTELSRKGTASKSKQRDRRQGGDGVEGPGQAKTPAVGAKASPLANATAQPAMPVKGPAKPPKTNPDVKAGTFVVREDSEI